MFLTLELLMVQTDAVIGFSKLFYKLKSVNRISFHSFIFIFVIVVFKMAVYFFFEKAF